MLLRRSPARTKRSSTRSPSVRSTVMTSARRFSTSRFCDQGWMGLLRPPWRPGTGRSALRIELATLLEDRHRPPRSADEVTLWGLEQCAHFGGSQGAAVDPELIDLAVQEG